MMHHRITTDFEAANLCFQNVLPLGVLQQKVKSNAALTAVTSLLQKSVNTRVPQGIFKVLSTTPDQPTLCAYQCCSLPLQPR